MRRSLDGWIPEPSPPEGFFLRPIGGEREVEAYVEAHRAAFGSTAVTADWRRRSLRDPRYRPALDLVAATPDGRLAAFCICWMARMADGHLLGQVEPVGVRPDYRGLGLGRALLHEGFRRLQVLGAESVEIEHVDWNEAAGSLYRSVGFSPLCHVLSFQKEL
jgi:ribosomal protein S18 acetylase RimI-like enzyme